MSSFLRTAVHVALGAGLLAVAGLGGLWLRDRGARWERPRWPDDSFVPLRAAPVAATPAPCSVVAVNPRCPHCLAGLTRLASDWRAAHRGEALVVLVVDSAARPPVDLFAAVALDAVWWDRRGVWRGRWGHRLYGERMRFDARGHYRDTIAAHANDDDGAADRAADDHDVPVPSSQGGTP